VFVVAVVCAIAVVGSFPLLVVDAAAASGSVVIGSQTSEPTSTIAGTDSVAPKAAPTARRSANGTTRTVTRALIAIAVATAVMASIYFWYTIPSRRKRLAAKRR